MWFLETRLPTVKVKLEELPETLVQALEEGKAGNFREAPAGGAWAPLAAPVVASPSAPAPAEAEAEVGDIDMDDL